MNLRVVFGTGLSVALCAKVLGAQGVTPFDTLKARALLERYFAHGSCTRRWSRATSHWYAPISSSRA